jgi:hypothetical protein
MAETDMRRRIQERFAETSAALVSLCASMVSESARSMPASKTFSGRI